MIINNGIVKGVILNIDSLTLGEIKQIEKLKGGTMIRKMLFVIAFAFVSFSAFAAAPDLNVGSASSFAGQSIAIPITADFSTAVGSIGFTLKYDPTLLTLNGVTVGASNSGWFIVNYSAAPGIVNIGMFSQNGVALSGTAQTMAIVNFTVGSGGAGGTGALPSPNLDASLVVFDNNKISTVTNGNFTLGLLGDVNSDGKVTIADAALVAQSVVGMTTLTAAQISAAEVDHTTTVNIYDCFLIAEYVTNIITKF